MDGRCWDPFRRLIAAWALVVLTAAVREATTAATAYAQHGAAGSGNALPAQPIITPGSNPYSAALGAGRYSPFAAKDSTAAERAVVAGRVYWTILDSLVEWAKAPPDAAKRAAGENALVALELAERLGKWSRRWQEAQDHTAKSLAGRQEALAQHLARMSSLEEGRFLRDAVKPRGLSKGEEVPWKRPALFAEILRFFRPVDERGLDRIIPAELVEPERPLSLVGIGVTAAQRAQIAGRVYRAILDAAVDRYLSQEDKGEAARNAGAIFDAALAERLASWSDLWRQAEDEADADAYKSSHLAAPRNGPPRLALDATTLAAREAEALPTALKSHIERLSALETGRFLGDAAKRAKQPSAHPPDRRRISEFVAVAKFFRIEAESQLADASRPVSAAATTSGRAAAASQFYQSILDGAARRFLALSRTAKGNVAARSIFDDRMAERLGGWSIRRARIEAGAGEGLNVRFAAIRSHFERMESLENSGAVREALTRIGKSASPTEVPSLPHEFADVARYFRLEARWEIEIVRSR